MSTKSGEGRDFHIGVLVTEAVKDELERIKAAEERSLSYLAYALMMRGLEQYYKDGQLGSIHNLPFKKGKPPKP